jgi:hypothetical protein
MNFCLDSNGIVYKEGYGIFFHDFTKHIGAIKKPRDRYILPNQKDFLNSLGLRTP